MKKTIRRAGLAALLMVLCLALSGCENEDERVRQALIEMGYMDQTPEPDATLDPAETPVPDESVSDPAETAQPDDVSDLPQTPGETSGTGRLPGLSEILGWGKTREPGATSEPDAEAASEESAVLDPEFSNSSSVKKIRDALESLPTPNISLPFVSGRQSQSAEETVPPQTSESNTAASE